MAKFYPQVLEEITSQDGYNFRYDFSFRDLASSTTVTNALTLNIFLPPRAGDRIKAVALDMSQLFANTADTAFNSTTVMVGDSGDTDNLITATECNLNGSFATFPVESTGDAIPYAVPATPLQIQITFTPTSGKALSALNQGFGYVRFKILMEKPAANLPQVGHETG